MSDLGSNTVEKSTRVRIRQLFEDGPLLPTISEGDESLVQYLLTLHNKGLETEHEEDRAASPLPELIIEVVPKRQDYDESDEFYKNLEKEMRRLYRRDFLHIYSNSNSDKENESLSNPETMDVEDNFDETIESYHKSPSLQASDKLSVDEEESENESDANELLNESENNKCSHTITQSDIEKGEHTSVYESRVDYEFQNCARALSLGKEKGTKTCDEESEAEEEQETEDLAENNGEDKSVYESRVDYEFQNSARALSLGKEKGTETCEDESEAEEEESEAEEEQETEDLAENNGEDKSVYEPRVDYEFQNSARALSLVKEKGTETCEDESEAEEEESEAEEEQETEDLAENNGEDKSVYESRVDYEFQNSARALSLGKEKGTETCEEESEAEEEQEMEDLAENNGASSTKSFTSLIPEPDVIRLRRCDRRLSSLSIPSYSQEFEVEIFEPHKKNLPMEVELEVGDKIVMSNMETQLSENTPEISIVNNATSTPTSQKSIVSRISSSKKYTKRFEPYSPHRCTLSRKQMCNETQQTSFSEDETEDASDTQSLWRNFFVGTPRFYKLV